METTKAAKVRKPAKAYTSGKTKKTGLPENINPSEDDIRAFALEYYNERIESGVDGNPEDDWLRAEVHLRKQRG